MIARPGFRGPISVFFILFAMALLNPACLYASDLVFGPVTCQRAAGAPTVFHYSFTAPRSSRGFLFKVFNGGYEGETYEPVSNGTITLNGIQILGPRKFNHAVTYLEVPVNLHMHNFLSVELRGKPGGILVIKVLPLVVIDTPMPGQAFPAASMSVTGHLYSEVAGIDVNGVPGIVRGTTFKVNDIPLAEGNNVLTARAIRTGGFTGKSSVTVIRDTTAPAITLTSPLDGSTVSTHSIDVTGSVDDPSADVLVNGSGVALAGTSFHAPGISLQVGRNEIPIEARDPLGNHATMILLVNYLPPVPTATLTAAPSQIQVGNDITLQWTTGGATSVSISPGIGTVATSGTITSSPTATTTYALIATGPGGTATVETTVTVTYPTPTVTLSASPEAIMEGTSTILSWTAADASTCSIEPGIGPVGLSGSRTVSPANTAIYTITCSGSGGIATASTTVNVNYLLPTTSVVAEPATIIQGTSSTLSWSSARAQTCTFDNGIGSVPCNGSLAVSPACTTTYLLTATGLGGSTTAQTTVIVTYPPPSVTMTATPATIIQGSTSTLSWTSVGADICSIDNGIGQVSCSGSAAAIPTTTTLYTISVSGPGGVATSTTLVTVAQGSIEAQISASPQSVPLGGSTVIAWTSSGASSVTISPSVGQVAGNGSVEVSPLATTTYTVMAVGPEGVSSSSVVVKVLGSVAVMPKGTFGAQYRDVVPEDATILAYDVERFSVVAGMIRDADGAPLSGVSITILAHPEYGTALTDADGRYIIPVDGGGTMTLVCKRMGYVDSHRKVEVPWNDYAVVDPIVLINADSLSTKIVFDGNPSTVMMHQSSKVADSRGSRSVTMVFSGDTKAYAVSDGLVSAEIPSLVVRATEYQTPESMPAKLPPTSGYTYCSELSVDGVDQVIFSKPVVVYVDNFLGFDVGSVVPSGTYDRQKAVWLPEENGTVIRLLDIDGDGAVDALDSNGDGLPDDHDGDGSFAGEVKGLGDSSRYVAGSTYWRVTIAHFTPLDLNWPVILPADAKGPDGFHAIVADEETSRVVEPCMVTNSYIQQAARIYHEDIGIAGSSVTLHYASDRAPGYLTHITFPVSGATVPASLKRIDAQVRIAGRTLTVSLGPEPNQKAEFYWDGLDVRGKPVSGSLTASLIVQNVFDAFYSIPAATLRSFAVPGMLTTEVPTRSEVKIGKVNSAQVLRQDSADLLAPGWTLSNHHRLDAHGTPVVFKGDGSVVNATARIITTIPGGEFGEGAEGEPLTRMTMDSAGNIYVVDTVLSRIRKVDRSGNVTTVAGSNEGQSGPCALQDIGDDGPAVQACLFGPRDVAIDSADNLYIADTYNNRIRKVDRNGIITTVAGNGVAGGVGAAGTYSGDDGPATAAGLNSPYSVAVDAQGDMYIADSGNSRIRRVDTLGIITTIAGGGENSPNRGDGGPATAATLDYPADVVIAADGTLFVADLHKDIRKIDAEGIITSFAGGGSIYPPVEGGLASEASFGIISAITMDKVGNIFVASGQGFQGKVWKISPLGKVTTIAGADRGLGSLDEGVPAIQADLYFPGGLAVDPRGDLFVAASYRIRKVSFPEEISGVHGTGDQLVVDSGLGYVFCPEGKHIRTVDLATGVTLVSFTYDPLGHLFSAADRFGNRLTIQRDGQGRPYSLISPDGSTTSLEMDSAGRLARVVYPDAARYRFEYDMGGLMTDEYDPNNNHFRHAYDASGRLSEVVDPDGGYWQISRTDEVSGAATSSTVSAEGDVSTFRASIDATGNYTFMATLPTGGVSSSVETADGLSLSRNLACGSHEDVTYGIDPLYKYRYVKEVSTEASSGLWMKISLDRSYQDRSGDGVADLITDVRTVNGREWTTTNDVIGGVTTSMSPFGRTATMTYDPALLLTSRVSVPGLLPVEYAYDQRGRLTSTTVGSRTTTLVYDASGNLSSLAGPDGTIARISHDLMGRPLAEERPDGSMVRYQYDADGNLALLTNSNDVSYGFGYTANNRRAFLAHPLSGSYQYLYDRDRRLKKVILPSGREIVNTYADGVMAATTTPEGIISYDYSCAGKMTSATRGGEQVAYAYDGTMLTTDTRTGTVGAAIGYTYNNDLALMSMTYVGSTASFGYDADGLLVSADGYALSRDAQNGVPLSVSGRGMTQRRAYSGYGEIDGETWTIGGMTSYGWNVTRDFAGRIDHREENISGETIIWDYAYDTMGRLTDVTKNAVVVERYTYDPNGNRLTENNALRGIGGKAYGHTLEDHVYTAGSDLYAYDMDGYLQSSTTAAGTTSYSYSSRGELQAAWLMDGRIITYAHDPHGRRIAKAVDGVIVEKYLWKDQTTLLAVFDGDGNMLQRYTYADTRMPVSMTDGGATYFLLTDQVGTLRAVADTSGAIVKRIDYDSFGNIIADTNPSFSVPFGFAGGLHDRDTGLVRFGARDYDPAIGRFTAKDPIDFAGGDTNLYAYTMSDPVNGIDPSGLWAGDVHSGVGRTDYGTFTWARQMGLSPSASTVMALANDATDAHGNWAPVAGVPGRHFDTALGGVDSRSLFADKELTQAISEYNAGNPCQAYKTLGRGLHSVQDIIAHMGWVPVLVHPSWYDNASFRTGALQATESASKAYLMRFLSATGQ